MADSFLEKRLSDYNDSKGTRSVKKKSSIKSLNDLILKNRSHRHFRHDLPPSQEQLKEIINVTNKIPSARNAQVLRYKIVSEQKCDLITKNLKLGAALSELQLPHSGHAPTAYIIICSTVPENKWVDMDLGISAQTMLLKAVELGLNGICIGAFNKEQLVEDFKLEYEPLLMLGLGVGEDKIQLTCAKAQESEGYTYYRKDGVHFVPKINIDDLIIP